MIQVAVKTAVIGCAKWKDEKHLEKSGQLYPLPCSHHSLMCSHCWHWNDFCIAKSVATEMIYRRNLFKTPNKNFTCSSRSDNFLWTLIEKIVNDKSFIALVNLFVKWPVFNSIEEMHNQVPPVTKMNQLPPDKSASAFAGTILDNKLKGMCPCCKHTYTKKSQTSW